MRKENKFYKDTGDPLGDKSFNLAIRIVQLFNFLQKDKKEYIISKQIFRSGTNPGAMVREAKHSESGKDFIHKLSIALKELSETRYWLDLLLASEYISSDMHESVSDDLNEVGKLLTSSIKTRKKNLRLK